MSGSPSGSCMAPRSTTEQRDWFVSTCSVSMCISNGRLATPGMPWSFTRIYSASYQEGLHEIAGAFVRHGDASGTIFAATNVALGWCILLALIFEPRGLAHRWMVLKNTFQFWPFPPR